MKTEITELLGIQYPIIQGGMAWVAECHLAAAVSNAGGLGLIGAANAPAEWVREQIREAKKMTDQPFGVNIMLMSPYADEVAKIVAEEQVKVVTTGAGNPEKYMAMWKEAGIKVIPVVASVALAKRMERCGADAVVAEGCEAGNYDISELDILDTPQEIELIRHIASLPTEIDSAALNYDPAKITKYSVELATLFHKFYDACSVKNAETPQLKKSRLVLCSAVLQVLRNSLTILKIDCPEKM